MTWRTISARPYSVALLKAAQETIGGMIDNGTIFGNYAHALEVILRLRQLCDHGCLIPANAGLNAPAAVVPNAPPSVGPCPPFCHTQGTTGQRAVDDVASTSTLCGG